MRWFFIGFVIISALVIAFTRSEPWPDENLAAALRLSKTDQRPIVAIVGAEWCKYCHQLERETLSDGKVAEALKQFRVVKIDADSAQGKEFSQKNNVQGLPTVVIFDGTGVEKDRIEGFVPPDQFLLALKS